MTKLKVFVIFDWQVMVSNLGTNDECVDLDLDYFKKHIFLLA
jgi:hypothetical protein